MIQWIWVEAVMATDGIVLVFEDDGAPFDPSGQAAPAPFTRLADAPIGGLRVALVWRLARMIEYARPAAREGDFGPVNRLMGRMAAGACAAAGL